MRSFDQIKLEGSCSFPCTGDLFFGALAMIMLMEIFFLGGQGLTVENAGS
jgi:hypothetical protein